MTNGKIQHNDDFQFNERNGCTQRSRRKRGLGRILGIVCVAVVVQASAMSLSFADEPRNEETTVVTQAAHDARATQRDGASTGAPTTRSVSETSSASDLDRQELSSTLHSVALALSALRYVDGLHGLGASRLAASVLRPAAVSGSTVAAEMNEAIYAGPWSLEPAFDAATTLASCR
jgi:hypothetical protein